MAWRIYKKTQGKNTRLWSAGSAAVISGLGCYQLYKVMNAFGANLWVETMVPFGLFVLFAVVIAWISNRRSVADFLISAEGELKKVSWSSRKEIFDSTLIVIGAVVFFAVLLGVTDICFKLFFSEIVGL